MPRKYSNNASTTLLNALNATDTVFIVENLNDAVAKFPDLSNPADYAILTVENVDSTYEIMRLTDIDTGTNQFTVVRGSNFDPADVDKTPSISFLAGARVELRATAGAFSSLLQNTGEVIHGGVFGTSPPPPDTSQTIITKHSTQVNAEPTLGDVEIGELAINTRTRKLFAGVIDAIGQKEVFELVPGVFVGTVTPSYPSEGMLWLDTTTNATVLKVYNGTAWVASFGSANITADLVLANLIALASRNAAGTAILDLIQLNGSNHVIVGSQSSDWTSIATKATKIFDWLRMEEFATGLAWNIKSGSFLGAPWLSLEGDGASSFFSIHTKNGANQLLQFLFGNDGFLRLPHTFLPTDPQHAATKYYVDYMVNNQVNAITHAVNVGAGGGIIGSAVNVSSVTKGPAGRYTVNLSAALTSMNNAAISVSGRNSVNSNTVVVVAAAPASTTTIEVRTRINSTLSDSDFSLIVFDTGA